MKQRAMIGILNELKRRGIAILFITHDLGIVAEIADRVMVVYGGKVMERSEVKEIFEEPMHPYTTGLLDCLPQVSNRGELYYIPGTIPSLINPPSGCVFHPRCKFKFEPCSKAVPSEYQISETHTVACHLYPGRDKK